MEWYVMNWNVNRDRLENFNIFNSSRFSDGVADMRGKIWNSVDEFVETLDLQLKCAFWCKAEYEVMVGDLFVNDCNNLTRVDVYSQVKPNIMQLARYILNYWANEGNE